MVGRALHASRNTLDFVGKMVEKVIFTYSTVFGRVQAQADITSIVREWKNGASNFGMVLYGDETMSQIAEISSAELEIVCRSRRATLSDSYQKNNLKRAGSSAVDLFTGRLLFEHTDFEFMSESMPMNIAHIYNSDYCSEEVNSGMKLGSGWRLNFQQYIEAPVFSGYERQPDRTAYLYTDGCGVQHDIRCRYYKIKNGETQYDSSARQYKQYVEQSESTFDYTTKEGLRFEPSTMSLYDQSGGNVYFDMIGSNTLRLRGFSKNGKSLEATYGTGDRIVSVTDGAGKVANFTYNGSGYLEKISCEGKTVSYEYSGNKLKRIKYPDGTYTEFGYTGDRLAWAKDRSGYHLDYGQSSDGKVESVREKIGNVRMGSTVTPAQ